MLFPDAPRVVYKNNVLAQVICQLRFPAILKIDTELPSAFQELIRDKFPIYQQSNENDQIQVPESISQFLPREFVESFPLRGNLRFQFLSTDRAWTISLTREFVALSTTQYECWEDFCENMGLVIQALINVYAPAFITRVGLRYQNVIDRKRLNLAESSWKDLIAQYILGPLAEEDVVKSIGELRNTTSFRLSDQNDYVRLEHGLIQVSGSHPPDHLYMLDNDLYSDKETQANAEHLTEKLNHFNAANRRLFNWCVTDRLREAMQRENTDF
ncbi:MAG: TIGR04255 family protein [Chloroflexota bacterium]|nr:TIGR04255 family protein [Chloroflexota bacterium]